MTAYLPLPSTSFTLAYSTSTLLGSSFMYSTPSSFILIDFSPISGLNGNLYFSNICVKQNTYDHEHIHRTLLCH